jgi:hypothetical protein
VPAKLCESWHKSRLGRAGLGGGLKAEEALHSLVAIVEAEFRNSSRPGSQAPHAPPALTFGLPGKQMVKPMQAGRVLMCSVSTLPNIRYYFIDAAGLAAPNAG